MFSSIASRLHGETNPLYSLRDTIRAAGQPIVDLVSGNVNEHGIVFPQDLMQEILAGAARRAAVYRPDSFGQMAAREAIAHYYGQHGLAISPDRIVLTPGTSLSYWYAFKLLADDGDEILCPTPSYPLFDYIALLSGVRLIAYRLLEREEWRVDLDHLEACISTHTRAVVLISPHNPTGHVLSPGEIGGIADLAARHGLAVICDEVFGDFLLAPGPLPRPAASEAPLVLTLNGFSKMFALPGMKIGWMALSGAPERVAEAARSLELISDTFLPVNETAQFAVPGVFQRGADFRTSYAAQMAERWSLAEPVLRGCPRLEFHRPQGGFYVTLALRGLEEEAVAEDLLRHHGLLVHPGHFYDVRPDHLVLSFVQQPEVITRALPSMTAALASM